MNGSFDDKNNPISKISFIFKIIYVNATIEKIERSVLRTQGIINQFAENLYHP